MSEVLVGRQYAHYKWGKYEVLHLATDEATGEEIVVYKSLSDDKVWTRRVNVFMEAIASADGQMSRFSLLPMEKLVRDRIPEIIRAEGKNPQVRQVCGDELLRFLKKKLQEEVDELLAAPRDIWEYADVFTVLREMLRLQNIPLSLVDQEYLSKMTIRWGLLEGWILTVDKK